MTPLEELALYLGVALGTAALCLGVFGVVYVLWCAVNREPLRWRPTPAPELDGRPANDDVRPSARQVAR